MSESARTAPSSRPATPGPRRDGVAVALGYEPDSGRAPTVLASGRGAVADQILAIAFAQGIKVREDADLAEILAAVDIDSEIPLEALAAVAEILSYVYRANGRCRPQDAPAPGEAGPTFDIADADTADAADTPAPGERLAAWRALFETPPPRVPTQTQTPPDPGGSAHD